MTNRLYPTFGSALTLVLCGAIGCASSRDNNGPGSAAGVGGWGGVAGIAASGGFGGTGGIMMVPVGEDCAAISQPAANRLQGADIIFAIDNSGSMDEEIVFVREQMNAFAQQIVSRGIDARIIVISAGSDEENGICIGAPLGSGVCPDDSSLPRYLHVEEEVGSNDALNLFVETFPQWRDQLRPGATKSFVVVTDDDATDEPLDSAAAFVSAIQALDPTSFTQWTFNGIYCFSECPDAAEIGAVYVDLVAQTGGVSGDLCLQSFAPVFDQLAQAVITGVGIECAWDIPPPPLGETLLPNRVNVQLTTSQSPTPQQLGHVASAQQCAFSGGWYYDNPVAPTRILACPATCDTLDSDPNAQLDVLFGCATVGSPD